MRSPLSLAKPRSCEEKQEALCVSLPTPAQAQCPWHVGPLPSILWLRFVTI
jgi:hypothetical protein